MSGRGTRIVAVGLALLACGARADDRPPWDPPPNAPHDQAIDDRLRSEAAGAIKSFKLLTGPVQRGPLLCSSPADIAAAARCEDGMPELVDRVRNGATLLDRIGAAAALGDMGSEGRDALLELLAADPDEAQRLACVAGLPPGDAASLAATLRWHPVPYDVESVTEFLGDFGWWRGCYRGRDFALRLDRATLECLAWDIVADDDALSVPPLVPLLRSPDAATRRGAAWAMRCALTRLAPDEPAGAEAALMALARDPDEIIRVAATTPSREANVPGVTRRRIALAALHDPSLLVRHAALMSLGFETPPHLPREVATYLHATAADSSLPDPARSVAAGLALAVDPTHADLMALLDACSERSFDYTECEVGAAVIEAHRSRYTPALRAYAEQRGTAGALKSLVELHVTLPVPSCIRLLESADDRVRSAALQMLRLMGASAKPARDAMVRVVTSEADLSLRREAAWTLLAVAPSDLAAVRAVLGALDDERQYVFVPDRMSRETLEQLAIDENPRVRRYAWTGLIRRAPSISAAVEVARRAGADRDVEKAVRRALVEYPGMDQDTIARATNGKR